MSENIVKKSIFKQEIHRKTYEYGENTELEHRYFHNAMVRKSIINISSQKISEEEIFVCELEVPLLEVGEQFYIEELEETVTIKNRVRSSKENVCYYVEPRIIEDEETLKTKTRAEDLQVQNSNQNKEIEDLKTENTKLIIENKNLKEFKKQVEKSFWFKFIDIEE